MVVGDDISVGRNNDTRTSSCALGRLYLTALCSAVALTEELSEESSERIAEEIFKWVRVLDGLCLRVDDRLDVDYGW